MNVFKYFLITILLVTLSFGFESDSRALKLKFEKMKKEQRVALIIGNSDYQSKLLSKLKNPINDAKLMRKILKSRNFKIYYLENATKREFKKSVKKFGNDLKRGGVGFFYYAGHGLQVNGLNYLVPVDANIEDKSDVEFETMPLNYITKKMKQAGNRLNIIVLDACRNDPFSRGGGGGLAPVSNAKGMFIAYATEAGSVASDGGDGKNGVFTKYLAKHIIEPLPIEQVFKKVRKDVINQTDEKQNPGVYSQIVGDFYFTIPTHIGYSNDESVWNFIKDKKDIEVFKDFIKKYPNSIHISEAKFKISKLSMKTDEPIKYITQNKENKYFKTFYDSFRNNRNKWEVNSQKYIRNGDYIFFNNLENDSLVSFKDIYLSGNYIISTSVKHLSGSDRYAYGVIFGEDSSNFYFFGISKIGKYIYGEVRNSKFKKFKWISSFYINRYTDNVLLVKKIGKYIHFIINDKEVKIVRFDKNIKKIGLFTKGNQKIAFHYLKAEEIKREKKVAFFNPFDD